MRPSILAIVLTATVLFAATLHAQSHRPSSAAQDAGTAAALRVDVTVKYEKGGETGVLPPGGALTTNDNYRVIFKPTEESFVYVFQIDATRRVDTIFPNEKYTAATNPVSAKLVYSVPPEGRWLHLDQRRGAEDIIVVASEVPLTDPKEQALRIRDTSDRDLGTRTGTRPADAAAPRSEKVFSYRLSFEHR